MLQKVTINLLKILDILPRNTEIYFQEHIVTEKC